MSIISNKTRRIPLEAFLITDDAEETRLIDEGVIIPNLAIVRVKTDTADYAVIGTGEDPLDECPELFAGAVS